MVEATVGDQERASAIEYRDKLQGIVDDERTRIMDRERRRIGRWLRRGGHASSEVIEEIVSGRYHEDANDLRLKRLEDARPCLRCGFPVAVEPGPRLVHIMNNGEYSTVGCRAATFDRSCLEHGDEEGGWDEAMNAAWKTK